MNEHVHDRFSISFEEDFDMHMLPWGTYRPTGIHIEVDGTLISSRSKDVYNVDDYIDANLKKMLRAVVKIAGGELARVPFWAVPLELRFSPLKTLDPMPFASPSSMGMAEVSSKSCLMKGSSSVQKR